MSEISISYKEDEKPIDGIFINNFCDSADNKLHIQADSGTARIIYYFDNSALAVWRLKPKQAKELGEALIKLAKQITKGV